MPHNGGHALISDARQFFKKTCIPQAVFSLCMLAVGITATILSYNADGNAQVPYFFSAYISFAWHLSFVVLSQVCIYYLRPDGGNISQLGLWVRVYSYSSSVMVLFNVMGVVFTVVNGICIRGQMCYYDINMAANRSMAIILIILHCSSILLCVFLAKRAHLIDAELNADISVKLNHPGFDFMKRIRPKSRKPSVASSQAPVTSSTGSAASICRRRSDETNTPDLHHVQTDHEGKVKTTVEIAAAMRKKRSRHRRSKSHPIRIVRNESLTKQLEIDGQVCSIYSDTEMRQTEEKKKKKIGLFRKRKKNRVATETPKRKTNQPDTEYSETEFDDDNKWKANNTHRADENSTSVSLNSSDYSADIVIVSPATSKQQKILTEQRKLQAIQQEMLLQQTRLYEEQSRLREMSSASKEGPPPYYDEDSAVFTSTTPVVD